MAIEVAKFVPFHSGLVVGVYLVQHEGHLAYAFLDETNVGANETTDDTVVIFGTEDKRVRSVFLGTVLWGPQLPNFQSIDKYIFNSEHINNHGMLCALDDMFDFMRMVEKLCPQLAMLSLYYSVLNFFSVYPLARVAFGKFHDTFVRMLEGYHREHISTADLKQSADNGATKAIEEVYKQHNIIDQTFEYRTLPSEPIPTAST